MPRPIPPERNRQQSQTDEIQEGGQEVRLQKLLAAAGLGSRRHCEEYITAGRVTVDGRVVRKLGMTVNPHEQKVTIDGEVIRAQRKQYYLLNKPTGYLCTNNDPVGRPRAVDLIDHPDARLFTVGRLDENSQGLLLITNDGEMAHRLAHPRFQAERIYRVQVAGKPTPETLNSLKEGIHFAAGKFRIKGYRRAETKGKSTFLEVVLTEGQNREIRRLFARVGHKVMSLQRVGFGPLRLGRLPLGKSRLLRSPELVALRELAAQEPAAPSRRPVRSKTRRPADRKTDNEKRTMEKKAAAKRVSGKSGKTGDRPGKITRKSTTVADNRAKAAAKKGSESKAAPNESRVVKDSTAGRKLTTRKTSSKNTGPKSSGSKKSTPTGSGRSRGAGKSTQNRRGPNKGGSKRGPSNRSR